MGTASSSKDWCFVLLELGTEVVEVMRVVTGTEVLEDESRPPSFVFSSDDIITGAGVGGRCRSGLLLLPKVPFLFLTTRMLCLILVRSGSRSMTFRVGERAASASVLAFATSSTLPPPSSVDEVISESIRLSQSAELTPADGSSDRRSISAPLSVEFVEFLLSLTTVGVSVTLNCF